MSLRERLLPGQRLDLGKNVANPRTARVALQRALAAQERRLNKTEATAVEVQLVAQVTPASEWPKLLAYWERRNPAGVRAWPRKIEAGRYALNLWPLPGGHAPRLIGVGEDVRKRQPKRLLCTPGLTVFDGIDGAETGLAVVCATWLEDVGMTDFQALRLAPPLLEIWGEKGRLLSREPVEFGLHWSVSA